MAERLNMHIDVTGNQSKTQERFFGSRRAFMQSYKKQLERKRFC